MLSLPISLERAFIPALWDSTPPFEAQKFSNTIGFIEFSNKDIAVDKTQQSVSIPQIYNCSGNLPSLTFFNNCKNSLFTHE